MKPLILAALAAACAAPMSAFADDKNSEEIKKLFAKNCALCHFNYGLDPGRGAPKLAGTQLSLKWSTIASRTASKASCPASRSC